jgi:hypothetical protein
LFLQSKIIHSQEVKSVKKKKIMLFIFVLFILSLYWLLSNKKIDNKIDNKIDKNNKKTKPSIDYMNVIRQKHLDRTRSDIIPLTSYFAPMTPPGTPVTAPGTPVTAPGTPVTAPGTPVTPHVTPVTMPDTKSPRAINESILMDDITVDKDPRTGKFNIFTLESNCLE